MILNSVVLAFRINSNDDKLKFNSTNEMDIQENFKRTKISKIARDNVNNSFKVIL